MRLLIGLQGTHGEALSPNTRMHVCKRLKLVFAIVIFVCARACIVNEVVASGERRPRLGALEEVGVIAALAKLHHNVEQPAAVRPAIHRLYVLLERTAWSNCMLDSLSIFPKLMQAMCICRLPQPARSDAVPEAEFACHMRWQSSLLEHQQEQLSQPGGHAFCSSAA